VIPSYNNSRWCTDNLSSVLNQEYDHFSVIYIDDFSTDNTGLLVERYINTHPKGNKVSLVRNSKRVGALANIYHTVTSLADRTIVVICDGDDWLAHRRVLKKLNSVYQSKDVWLTYGGYQTTTYKCSCTQPVSNEDIKKNRFRDLSWRFAPPRTFYAALFKKIKKEDLMLGTQFFTVSGDVAIMYPMLEMAGKHIHCIDESLYIYNTYNPLNDYKHNKKMQINLGIMIKQKPRYSQLDNLFV
jgi:glycosyltransferase involved in cell wall biosynthesis